VSIFFGLSKSEYRNPKFETNSNYQNSNDQNVRQLNIIMAPLLFLSFGHYDFGFVSDFVLLFSNFKLELLLKNLYADKSGQAEVRMQYISPFSGA
jgi:hypothetical protein